MVNKKLHLVCRQELSTVTSAAHSTSHDGFSAAIEFGRVNADLRGRVDAVLARTAAELPVGGELAWKWTATGDGVSLEATGLVDCEALELAAIAEGVVDAVCETVERREQ